jgi:hypothetical protein
MEPIVTATIIKMSIQRMACVSCGAEANASCNCGVNYQPKSIRATEAVRANPGKSDRAIAAEIGVSPMTVNRVRATVPDVTVDKRVGLDGKTRRAAKPKAASSKDIAAERFDTHVLELIRLTKGHKPQRFAKTAVALPLLGDLAHFIRELVTVRRLVAETPTDDSAASAAKRKAAHAAAEGGRHG